MADILKVPSTQDAAQPEQPVQPANELTAPFKPGPVSIELDGTKYNLVYDLNAFCEMETIYDSVDSVIQMLLGTAQVPDLAKVSYRGVHAEPDEIMIDNVKLSDYIKSHSPLRRAKHSDTLNLLWLGCLHDHTQFDAVGNVTGYTISKAKLGSMVTLLNLREVNGKIVTAILRDLMPAVAAAQGKNQEPAEAPEA